MIVLLVFGGARTVHADAPVPLRYTFERGLPLGFRLDVAPGVMVVGVRPIGATGLVRLRTMRDLIIVGSNVDAYEEAGVSKLRWSVDLHLGGELQPKLLAGHVWRGARKLAKRIR
jgi:hypothetical protein